MIIPYRELHMGDMDYWKECVIAGLEEADLSATEDQVEALADSVRGGYENYGMAHGYDVISRGSDSPEKKELDELRQWIAKKETWEAITDPCPVCITKGWVLDGWGRNTTCPNCDGKGRVRSY